MAIFNAPSPLLVKSTQQFLNSDILKIGGEQLAEDGLIGTKTKAAISNAIINLRARFKSNMYSWDNINIVGFRTNNIFTNTFTDWICYVSDDNFIAVPGSTKAGNYYVKNPVTYGGIKGTAVMIPGYYKNLWAFRTNSDWKTLWLGMPYMQQINDCSIYRDGNLDDNVNEDSAVQKGQFGINHHHAGIENIIYNWSAGCQIVQKNYYSDVLACVPFVAGRMYSYWLIKI